MRGDLEILAYNLIQWAGGNLPWKTNNLLGNPTKVQEAKESLMNAIDTHIGECFDKIACPEPILKFMKLVAKLKFDEKPNYESYRKEFQSGLRSIGKSDSGDLDFKATKASPAKAAAAAAASTVKEQKKSKRADTSKASNKSQEDTENISPKPRAAASKSKKRSPPVDDDSFEGPVSPTKKPRGIAKNTSRQIVTSQSTGAKSSESMIVVNNRVNSSKSGPNKTYELNFELNVSLDANVVVNVTRKAKKPLKMKKTAAKESSPLDKSTDEIPATEKSYAIGTAKVFKRGVRTSPRGKK